MPLMCTSAAGSSRSGGFGKAIKNLFWYSDGSNAHHAVTLNGSVTQSDEGGGVKAASFANNDGYLQTNNIPFIGSEEFTIECFIKPSSTSGFLFGQTNGGGEQPKICVYRSGSGGLAVDLGIRGTYDFTPWLAEIGDASLLHSDEWNHLAITSTRYNASVYFLNVYVNGNKVYQNSSNIDLSQITGPFIIGAFDGRLQGFRIVLGTAIYNGNTLLPPTTLLTAVSGTQLLLNFGATNTPIIDINDTFTDAFIFGTYNGNYNVTPCSYTTHNGLFYVAGVPYTGTHAWTEFAVQYDGYGQTGYTPTAREMRFVDGVAVGDPSLGYVSWIGYPHFASGETLHGNLYTDLPTLAIGTKVYTFDGTNYNQVFSSYYLAVGTTQYQYSGGIISSSGPA